MPASILILLSYGLLAIFLVFFLIVAYLMKRDYWKDVH